MGSLHFPALIVTGCETDPNAGGPAASLPGTYKVPPKSSKTAMAPRSLTDVRLGMLDKKVKEAAATGTGTEPNNASAPEAAKPADSIPAAPKDVSPAPSAPPKPAGPPAAPPNDAASKTTVPKP
jgi:hypothetical protein